MKQYIADRRLAAVSLVLGVLMGLMILLGIRYSRNELIYRTAGQFLGQLAGWVVCMTVMVWAICVGLDALGRGWPKIRDFQFGKFLPVNSYQKRTQARRGKTAKTGKQPRCGKPGMGNRNSAQREIRIWGHG
ncbi:MAG: hypothetical protein ACLT76_00075 [Clostridium fessum]